MEEGIVGVRNQVGAHRMWILAPQCTPEVGGMGRATSATPDHNDSIEGPRPPQQNSPVHSYTLAA